MSDDPDLIPIEMDSPPASPWTRESVLPSTALLWHMPPHRSPHFTGRDALLAELRASLLSTKPLAHTQALVGMAGIGKSQIALEYAHRYREDYSLVWWLRAGDEGSLVADCGELTRHLFPGTAHLHPQAARKAMREELARRPDWLLIFDGAAEVGIVADCLPDRHSGHVIVTSRNPNWRGIGSVFPVPPLERGDSIFLLRSRSGRTESLFSAGHLAKALGDLPLALDQAAALIEQTRISFDEYLRRYEGHWAELLERGRSGQREDSLAMSLELSFRALETTAPAAAELLNLLAFLGAGGIQKQALASGASAIGDSLGATAGNPILLHEAVAALLRHSLIELADDEISMHQIVAALARDRLSLEQRTEWSHRALRFVDSCFRFDSSDPRTWAQSGAMLPHAMAAVEYVQQTDVTIATVATLLNQVGQCLSKSARYDEARLAFDRALSVGYQIYGETNPRLSPIANNLGRVLLKLGELDAARQQFEWALSLDERAYGPTHAHVAEVLNNLGLCQARLNADDAARQSFERALAIYESQFGPSHANAATILNNLGCLKMNAGDLTGAWDMLQRALGSTHAAYGPNHPDVASILLNLGDVLRLQGSHAAAKAQYTRALVVDEIAYGADHPEAARDLGHLAALLMDLEDFAPAEKHLRRALAIDEAVFGADHVNLIIRWTELGRCLKATNQIDAAVACFTRRAELSRGRSVPREIGGI